MSEETEQALISIVIPVYNRPELIREAVKSLQAQTYTNWECIIVDDISTDNTFEIIGELAKSDRRIRPYRREREPKGAPTCRNIGVDQAKGKYLMFLDSDDLLGTKCLEFRVDHFIKNPNADFIAYETQWMTKETGDNNRKWNVLIKPQKDIIRFLHQDMPWCIHGVLWKRKKTNRFDENTAAFQDWEFHVRSLIKTENYLKFESSDIHTKSFYRVDDTGRPTISNASYTAKESRRQTIHNVLVKVSSEVLSENLAKDIKKEASKLILNEARWARKNKGYKSATKVWRNVLNDKAYSKLEYIALKMFLLIDLQWMQKPIKFVAYKIFKRETYVENKTLGKE